MEGVDTWVQLNSESLAKNVDWGHLMDDVSVGSDDEMRLRGVSLSSRSLSARSHEEYLGLNGDAALSPDRSRRDIAPVDLGPRGLNSLASDVSESHNLRAFHNPSSASSQIYKAGQDDTDFSEASEGVEAMNEQEIRRLSAVSAGASQRTAASRDSPNIRASGFERKRSSTVSRPGERGLSMENNSPLPQNDQATLSEICGRGRHTSRCVKRAEMLVQRDKSVVKDRDEHGKMPVHLLCEAGGHSKHSVELLTLILKAHKSGAKQTVAHVRNGGLLPIHLICMNHEVTESSEAMLRMLLHANEEGGARAGGSVMEPPLVMLCRGRAMTGATLKMFRRLVEAHREAVKDKNHDGGTLLHLLCASSRHSLHTEHSVEALRTVLDAHKRGPEIADAAGLRPLHVLCRSQPLTAHSVSMCKLLLEKSEHVAGAADEGGMLPVHHICSQDRLSKESLEVCRKVLDVFERGAEMRDSAGRLPLHLICESKQLSKVSVDMARQLLLAHKQAYAVPDERGRLPVHSLMCCMTRERLGAEFGAEILEQLLWSDKSALETPDDDGRLPLHLLCASGLFCLAEVDMLDKLLAHGGAAAGMTDNFGDIPLHLLCASTPHSEFTSEGFQKLCKVLDGAGSSTAGAAIAGQGGKLPLHCLCASGEHTEESVQMFEWLVEENVHGIAHKDSAGMAALHWLCSAWGHTEYSEIIFDELVRALQQKGVQISEIKTRAGLLPLHILCGAGKHTPSSYRIFERLVEAHPNAVCIATTLSMVALNSFMPTVLQRSQADDDDDEDDDDVDEARRTLGRLPLHFLCGSEEHTQHSVDMCQHLLRLNRDAVLEEGDDGLLPLHLLCTSVTLTSQSVAMSRLVVDEYEAQTVDREGDLRPLLYVCQSRILSEHSESLCKLLLESQARCELRRQSARLVHTDGESAGPNGEAEHLNGVKDEVLDGPRDARFRSSTEVSTTVYGVLPLLDLCASHGHTEHSVAICKQLLAIHPEWAKTPGHGGKLPLHLLCACAGHTTSSADICTLLLDSFPDAIQVQSHSGCLPLHLLCDNPALTRFSTTMASRLLRGSGARTASALCYRGCTPLYRLCSQDITNSSQVEICKKLVSKHPDACSLRPCDGNPKNFDMDLPLHRLARADNHSEHSVAVCQLLVDTYPAAIAARGEPMRGMHGEDDNLEEDEEVEGVSEVVGDIPLMMCVKRERLCKFSAQIAMMLVDDGDDLPEVLRLLADKVYRPKGDEVHQQMALRMLICLAFIDPESVISYFQLDESPKGAHSISFMKEVVDDLGYDVDNPLHHVLRAGQLYKTLADNETASMLVLRLSKLSDVHVQWASEMVEGLSGKVAKRAIWTPEKDSEQFMTGDSPIGLALDLGDLRIVSHGAVFDVVKEAWPGEFKFQYNPFAGSMYNNLLFEFSHSSAGGKDGKRAFKWTWKPRLAELANPEMFNSSPMMMYWLGIFFQTTFLCVFHIVVESSAFANDYRWSLGPASWYLISHVTGGILFEVGQLIGDGLAQYSQDPWNVIDVSMYSLLAIWIVYRVADAMDAQQVPTLIVPRFTQIVRLRSEQQHVALCRMVPRCGIVFCWVLTPLLRFAFEQTAMSEFIPECSVSSEFLGLAAVFIHIRMLNVFGLDQNFGPLVRIIQGMVPNVFVFLCLLLVFLAGFATALKSIFRRMDPDSPEFEGVIFPIDNFSEQQAAMLSLLDMALGQFGLVSVFAISPLAFWVVFVFLAATFIMLFNLLIALMTDTYAKIRETSEQLWKKDRALLMAAYTKTEKMSMKVNLGAILTALPQPLNLLVTLLMLLCSPFYLLFKLRNNPEGKGWQQLVNQLQKKVMNLLLFLIVCVPFCLLFLFIILPLNWIFVASAGLFEYLGLTCKGMPSWIKTILSQVLGVVFAPLIFAIALICTPIFFLYHEVRQCCCRRRREAEDDDDATHYDLTNALSQSELRVPQQAPGVCKPGGGFRGSLAEWEQEGVENGDQLGRLPSMVMTERSAQGAEVQSLAKVIAVDKIWEQNLDEDDKAALLSLSSKVVHRASMPVDTAGEDEDGDGMGVNEEDAALQEVRAEISKKMGALDGNQRTILQTARDLQIESKTTQQQTASSITKLEAKVSDMALESVAMARAYEDKMEALRAETHSMFERMAEMLVYQAQAQIQVLGQQDRKISALMQTMGCEDMLSRTSSPEPSPNMSDTQPQVSASRSLFPPPQAPPEHPASPLLRPGMPSPLPAGARTPAPTSTQMQPKTSRTSSPGGHSVLSGLVSPLDAARRDRQQPEGHEQEAADGAGACATTQEIAEAAITRSTNLPAPVPSVSGKSAASFAAMDKLLGRLKMPNPKHQRRRSSVEGDQGQKTKTRRAVQVSKKPALVQLEEHVTESSQQTKTQMADLAAKISSLAPSLDMLQNLLEAQNASSAMVLKLQEKLTSMEPALDKLGHCVEQAERTAAASSGELRGSVASLNPQIAALEEQLVRKQTELSGAMMRAMEEKVAGVSSRQEASGKELLQAWESRANALEATNRTQTRELRASMDDKLQGLSASVGNNEKLLRVVEAKVEQTSQQCSTAMAKSQQLEGKVEQAVARQSAEFKQQLSQLDLRVVQEIASMDARVMTEMQDMQQRSAEQAEEKMESVRAMLQGQITATYENINHEHSEQIEAIHSAIAAIGVDVPQTNRSEQGPKFTWSDRMGPSKVERVRSGRPK